jgi:hypothetical protein
MPVTDSIFDYDIKKRFCQWELKLLQENQSLLTDDNTTDP